MDPKLIIMACRESEKARQAHQLVCEHHPHKQSNVVLEFVDLADLSSIKDLVGRLSHQSITVDILINNAGVILNEKQQTKDGFEMQVYTIYHGQMVEMIKPTPSTVYSLAPTIWATFC